MSRKGPAPQPWLPRFMSKVSMPTGEFGCMEWTAALYSGGYGHFGLSAKEHWLAHRLSYTYWVGEIPEGLDIDHLCRNRKCVRVDHLEPVSRQVNLLRGATTPAARAAQTHCKHGHEFNDENTRIDKKSRRHCRACDKTRSRERVR